ncbi:MAG: right-handed parallel beta-helix repeat-containing protein [Armatimonadetes bacterium]|nr:right-handed parallel beta-helix repeat-containing protein [Armatimonadota bacterium]
MLAQVALVVMVFTTAPVVTVDAPGPGPTAGIQEALDSMRDSGGRVILGPGRYVVSETVRVPSNCILEGAGAATVLEATTEIRRRQPPRNRVVSNADPDGGNENIIIRDLVLDGVGHGEYHFTGIYGLNLSNCRDCTIERLWVRNCSGEGILVNYGGGKVIVRGCVVSACNHGINVHHRGAGYGATETLVDGNIVRNNRCIGIFCEAASNMVISDNLISDNGWAGIVWMGGADEARGIPYPARGVTIVGNMVLRNGDQGGIFINGTYSDTTDFVVVGNVCRDNGRDGIWAFRAHDGVISGNLCADNNRPAQDGTLADWQQTASGIRLAGCRGVTVTGNTCHDSPDKRWQIYGICGEGDSDGNVVCGNRVGGNASGGVKTCGATTVISGNGPE